MNDDDDFGLFRGALYSMPAGLLAWAVILWLFWP
jgi:hypothetical protein